MIELSEKTKQECLKYMGPDGKFVIDESVPESLVETFQFFNDNNINVLNFKLSVNDSEEEPIETDEELDFEEEDDFEDDMDLDDDSDDDLEEIDSAQVEEDLSDFF